MDILTTIVVVGGKLARFPNSHTESVGRSGAPHIYPWAASLKSPESFDYIDEFLNEKGTAIVPVDRFRLHTAVVFACDEYDFGRISLFNRWYGVVVSVDECVVVFEQYASQEEAYNAAKARREDVPF